MSVPVRYEAFWSAAERAGARLDRVRFLEAFAFGSDARMAASLADLVLHGDKRATAGLVWSCDYDGKTPPRPGDFSIVTTWAGDPLCIIETTAVVVLPFEDVPESFARLEGEGDRTLASWRRDHEAYFAGECARIGREPHPRMPVLCERFDVVYPPASAGRDASGDSA